MPQNKVLRLVDWLGEGALSTAELTYDATKKRLEVLAKILREHEIAANSLMQKKRVRDEERRRALEARLTRILEAVSDEEDIRREFFLEREELKRPFSERLAEVISRLFSRFSLRLEAYFVNIQEDLYKANIMMTSSRYVSLAVGVSAISALIFAGVFGMLFWRLAGVLGGALSVLLIFPFFFIFLTLTKMYPKSRVKSRSDAFSRELPFALRHMATQLASGSGLLETMRSISLSDYGVLSEEFRRAILEVERGSSVDEAYERMNLRIESPGLRKASRQIVSTLRTGGNLAKTLKVIADEVATDMRMKLKDFIQTLNTFSLMYMFIVIVAPVLVSTLLIALGIATKSFPVPLETMWLVYLTFFGISLYMAFMIKRFEPKV
jgi:pilus assembly protein TadC